MITVNLSYDEWFHAVEVGLLRQHHSLHKGSKDSLYHKPWMDQLDIHILGACGECAVAKALNKFWPGHVNKYQEEADIPPGYEVRHRTKDYYDLIVHEKDPDKRLYILTIGAKDALPKIKVVGWMVGSDAKKEEWKQTYGGWKAAYFVPQKELRPIEELLREA